MKIDRFTSCIWTYENDAIRKAVVSYCSKNFSYACYLIREVVDGKPIFRVFLHSYCSSNDTKLCQFFNLEDVTIWLLTSPFQKLEFFNYTNVNLYENE